mgnify:CR=1 FL=1
MCEAVGKEVCYLWEIGSLKVEDFYARVTWGIFNKDYVKVCILQGRRFLVALCYGVRGLFEE